MIRLRNLSVVQSIQIRSGAHPASCSVSIGGSIPVSKALVAWDWPLTSVSSQDQVLVVLYLRNQDVFTACTGTISTVRLMTGVSSKKASLPQSVFDNTYMNLPGIRLIISANILIVRNLLPKLCCAKFCTPFCATDPVWALELLIRLQSAPRLRKHGATPLSPHTSPWRGQKNQMFELEQTGNILTNIQFYIVYLQLCFTQSKNFDVLLTVHLSIFILVINQPDAQNFVLQ